MGTIVGIIIRIIFFNSIVGLNNKIREANKQVSSGVIWCSVIPFLSMVLFPYVILKVSSGLYFELADRKVYSKSEFPTRTTGFIYFATSFLAEVFIFFGVLADEPGLVLLAIIFVIPALVFFIIYWVQIAKYSKILNTPIVNLSDVPTVEGGDLNTSDVNKNEANKVETKTENKLNDSLLMIFIGVAFVSWLVQFLMHKLVNHWYESPFKYIQSICWILQNLSYLLLPILVKNKALRIVGFILTGLFVAYYFSVNLRIMF